MAGEDSVDRVIAQWRRVRPDLEDRLPAMALVGRIGRLAIVLGREVEAELRRFDLSRADFDVLASLRRADAAVTPTQLVTELLLSPSGMTGRLDRLASRGYVTRSSDPDDRRSLRVELTDSGREVVDRAVTAHVDNEQRLLAGLSRAEQEQLSSLLSAWLASVTGEAS